MSAEQPRKPAEKGAAGPGQYLTFTLGQEEYGVEILRVQEIKGFSPVTPIPNAPGYVKGVMNLRGTVVPVFDLRLKFGMESRPYDRFTVIVVVNVASHIVGLIVDAVSDVVDIRADAVEPAPELGATVDTSILRGVARNAERLISLLDIDRIVEVGTKEAPAVTEASAAA